MPETEVDTVTKEWLQAELRSGANDLIVLDCRSSNEYLEGHIRSAVNFSIPSIMLRRLAAGKIDLTSTIKCRDLKNRIQAGYKMSLFVLYNDTNLASSPLPPMGNGSSFCNILGNNIFSGGVAGCGAGGTLTIGGAGNCDFNSENQNYNHQQQQSLQNSNNTTTCTMTTSSLNNIINSDITNTNTINVLHRRLKQDGCRVVCLQDGFSSFRDTYPEWCEDNQNQEIEASRRTAQTDQLMGLRSLRISTPHSDSACSSSAESSDCESITHHHLSEAPVEIVPGLFLGNASHSGDSSALQKYNIKYVLNVTPDLPNVFEASGGIQYLQIPITDHYSQDVAVHFPTAIQFIEEARAKGSAVLVHCLAGVSRSVTVTLAYLMRTKSLCLNDAFSLVRDRKPDISPNFHFMEQLNSFEQELGISPNRTVMPNTLSTKDCERCPRTKFACSCIDSECKCLHAEFLANAKATGVSPDSGIEFDRWTPSDAGLK